MGVLKTYRCIWRLLADRKGASVMETAIVVPTLAVLVMGASDLAMGFAQKVKIQQAAARAIEMATAGGVSSSALTTLKSEGATAAGVPETSVTLDNWLECDGVRQSSFDGTCSTSGAQMARFVSISISGSYAPMFSFLLPQSRTSNGSVTVSGYSAVRVQ